MPSGAQSSSLSFVACCNVCHHSISITWDLLPPRSCSLLFSWFPPSSFTSSHPFLYSPPQQHHSPLEVGNPPWPMLWLSETSMPPGVSIKITRGFLVNPRRACAARVTVVVLCVCMYVCLSEHAILAVRAVRSITKDAIMLSVRFAAILKRRFS